MPKHGLKKWIAAIVVGTAVGAACGALTYIPWVGEFEQDAGLRWLFRLRGAVPPPQEVVIVTMNRRSAAGIFLPRDPHKAQRCREIRFASAPLETHEPLTELPTRWPRCLHAILVDRLMLAGARVVAFDVLFRERPRQASQGEDVQAWQDLAMAKSFATRRVLIAQKLEEYEGGHRLVELSPAISASVLGTAPFPVRKSELARTDRFITFMEVGWPTPTLPALALQADALESYPHLTSLLQEASLHSDSAENPRQLEVTCLLVRQLIRKNPELAEKILKDTDLRSYEDDDDRPPPVRFTKEESQRLRAVVAMYSGEAERLLNLYGPAGTILQVGYDEALSASPDKMRALFANRVTFVGTAEPVWHEKDDHFMTAFSNAGMPDISGVEIAATAYGNLLHDSSIRQVSTVYWTLLVFVFGFMATVMGRILKPSLTLPVLGAAIAGLAGLSFYMFAYRLVWVPFVLPLFVATPAGLVTALAWNFQTARRQRENIRRALSKFIPREVVDQFEANSEDLAARQSILECGCVATDAANYTPLAETMEPHALSVFLNGYFDALFRPVGNHGGFVSDYVGDAMVALWPHRSTATRDEMLTALLQMRDAAVEFNAHSAQGRLMTRFGADWGQVSLGAVGARKHYEYKAVGDTINTSARIQELNKKLGTTILVSRRAIGPAGDGFMLRDLGRFRLRGKSIPVEICELVGTKADATDEQIALGAAFAHSLELAFHGSARDALASFRDLRARYPGDGPTAFYLSVLEAGEGPANGVLRVN